jgi:DNA invertase Pin-like site-specific DNA recombinase
VLQICIPYLDMLGVFAEFETNLRRELEGIAKAKAAGASTGVGSRRLIKPRWRSSKPKGSAPPRSRSG